MKKKSMTEEIERIAKDYLNIDTLETRRSDGLDFHDVAVWSVKSALLAAYMAGASSNSKPANTANQIGEA